MRGMLRSIFLFVLVPAPLLAQDPLVGTWKVTYPAGARVDNGEQSVIMGTGTLRIAAQGDSLVGELLADPVPDLPTRGPRRLAGLAGHGSASLVSLAMGMVDSNGVQRAIMVQSTWQLQAKGDSVIGVLTHKVDGAEGMAQDPGQVRGVRLRQPPG